MTLRRLGTLLVLVLAAGLLSAVAIGTGRTLAAVLAAVAVVFGLALALQADRYESTMDVVADAGEWALALAPGLLIAYFGFNGGGYFPAAQGFVATVLALVLALRLWLASEPLAGFGPLSAVVGGLLALYAAWTGLSASWSHAPGHALVEFDRALLYLLAFLLFASVARSTDRLRLMLRGIAAGAVLVCMVGLITRVAPDVWPIAADVQRGRLGYPLTYWNAFGLLAALGLITCGHLAASEREPRLVRILGAAAMPPLGAALLFTFSRGGILVAALGLVAYALLARPRGIVGAVLATGPTTALAVATAYGADRLASNDPASAAAASQGHHVALVVGACAVAAAVIRGLALPLDGALARARLPARWRRVIPALAWSLGVLATVVVFFAAHGPDRVSTNYDHFVHGNAIVATGDFRSRLGEAGNNRRIDQWDVAIDGYRKDRFKGTGAGTYANLWNQLRPVRFAVRDAHSLYVEVLGELGIAGLVLLVGALVLILFGFARGMWRARDRYVHAAFLAAALAWVVHAGLDWDWEMPAVTIWLFCAGGAALAVSTRNRRRVLRLRWPLRLVLALAVIAVAVVPAATTVSQHRLDEAVAALSAGDCTKAEREARRSLDLIGFRPEPREVIAVCAARRGALAESLHAIREAIRRDPANWRYRFFQAIILAAGGRPAAAPARAAANLDPLEPAATGALARLTGPGARTRARESLALIGR